MATGIFWSRLWDRSKCVNCPWKKISKFQKQEEKFGPKNSLGKIHSKKIHPKKFARKESVQKNSPCQTWISENSTALPKKNLPKN
jgi:hypothetical protein